jgi:hypothetical protein
MKFGLVLGDFTFDECVDMGVCLSMRVLVAGCGRRDDACCQSGVMAEKCLVARDRDALVARTFSNTGLTLQVLLLESILKICRRGLWECHCNAVLDVDDR